MLLYIKHQLIHIMDTARKYMLHNPFYWTKAKIRERATKFQVHCLFEISKHLKDFSELYKTWIMVFHFQNYNKSQLKVVLHKQFKRNTLISNIKIHTIECNIQ